MENITEHVCNALVHSQRVIEEIDSLESTPVFRNEVKFHGKRFREALEKSTDEIFKATDDSENILVLFDLHNSIHKSIDELDLNQKTILNEALLILVKEIKEHGALFINGRNIILKNQTKKVA